MFDTVDKDIIEGVRGTLTKLRMKEFTQWINATHVDAAELVTDAISETLLAIHLGGEDTLQDYINKGVREALKFHRKQTTYSRQIPWDYSLPESDEFEPEQFITNGRGSEPEQSLPVDLSLLDDRQLRILELFANGFSATEVVEEVGRLTDDHSYVQNVMSQIRKTLLGKRIRSQRQAYTWLEEHNETR